MQGINNIFLIKTTDGETLQCRIKGKTLQGSIKEYNPLAPGDRVVIQKHNAREGLVVSREERMNSFVRWNMKRDLPQTIAANIDRLYCVTSAKSPKFKPKFIDRIGVCTENIPITIIVNKGDLGIDKEIQEYVNLYRSIGYEIMVISAFDSGDIAQLLSTLHGTRSVFFGQSGVGKSTLINALIPEAKQMVRRISDKHDRGRHTTNYGKWIESKDFSIIDTPGVREIEVPIMSPYMISSHFPEFAKIEHSCRYSPCLHLEEPSCAVLHAVSTGVISEERYKSYVQITLSMIERRKRLFYGI